MPAAASWPASRACSAIDTGLLAGAAPASAAAAPPATSAAAFFFLFLGGLPSWGPAPSPPSSAASACLRFFSPAAVLPDLVSCGRKRASQWAHVLEGLRQHSPSVLHRLRPADLSAQQRTHARSPCHSYQRSAGKAWATSARDPACGAHARSSPWRLAQQRRRRRPLPCACPRPRRPASSPSPGPQSQAAAPRSAQSRPEGGQVGREAAVKCGSVRPWRRQSGPGGCSERRRGKQPLRPAQPPRP